jgi:hypothetical protein
VTTFRYKPDISVKLSPRITKQTSALIDRICRRHEMFEADVLRLCLEAVVPLASKRGMTWLTRQIPGFERNLRRDLGAMVTVRTSRRVKAMIDKLKSPNSDFGENEVVRYCYDYILPIAYREGFAKIMAMREEAL